jgi:hypothetical protein
VRVTAGAVRSRPIRRSTRLQTYEETLRLHVWPGLGSLRIREVRVGVVERFVAKVEDKTGKSAARRCKTVLNGIMGLAAIHEAIDHNPVRDTSAITVASQDAEALTLPQVREIRLGSERTRRRSTETSQRWSTSCSAPAYGSERCSP